MGQVIGTPPPTSPALPFPLDYIVNHTGEEMAVITGAPVAIVIIILIVWLVFRFLHQRQLDQIPILERQLKAKEDDIIHLKASLAGKTEEMAQLQTQSPTSTPLSLFSPKYFMHDFLARTISKGIVHFSSISPQEAKTLLLRITVTFTAVPDVEVEQVYLELMNKRLPSDWRPQTVHHRMTPDVTFDIPAELNAGSHRLKLIAIGAGFEKASPEFQIDFPAR